MRLFNEEGVEFSDEDLKYLKDNQSLYLSKGEDFDASSSFGEYEIVSLLGEGGFGKVSLGRHRLTNELAAIKVMKVSSFGSTAQIDLVFREAESLQALDHPSIVRIFKYYTLEQMQVIVVMEYMAGGELLARLKEKGRFGEEEAKTYFKQIVKAIDFCHSRNIIHRDLKLENILLKDCLSNEVKVPLPTRRSQTSAYRASPRASTPSPSPAPSSTCRRRCSPGQRRATPRESTSGRWAASSTTCWSGSCPSWGPATPSPSA